jgi:ribonuclease-3
MRYDYNERSQDESYENGEGGLDVTTPHVSRKEIQDLLGMRPKNLDHYLRAFVHKSVNRNVKEAKNQKVLEYMTESYERLEFLGDSVLGLIVTNFLFKKFPHKAEGFLTRTKTKIVRREGCALFARHIGLGKYILTSDRIKIDKGSDKILEDTFEAFVGAIFNDLGFKHANEFILRLIEECIDFDAILADNNYKDVLLRYSQSKGYPNPVYAEIAKEGQAHNCMFTMSAKLITGDNTFLVTKGKAKSKKQAEQEAAKLLLSRVAKEDLGVFINRDK